jgi:hypothetical protein
MNYKDTIMSEDKISSIARSCGNEDYGYAVAEEQAEKSFKAGAKEVAKWVYEQGGSLDGHYKEWHKQLLKWGVFKYEV